MNYRSDIDGLRAIAVLSVIFFHADLAWFSGGFVGVDIFFVISGFLISSLILNDLRSNRFEIKAFYLRRARRLGPSLFVVLSSTLIAGFLLFDSGRFFELGKGLLSSVLFGSNWLFALQTNYFDAQSELNPLLHTWSLGIEEQFYLIWPLVLIILYKLYHCSLKSVSGILIGLTVLSFSLNVWLIQKGHSDAAFFNTFGRIWELLIGATVAVLIDRITVSSAMAKFLRILGISAIALSIYYYDGATPFPGVAALLPVLGTALILSMSQDQNNIVFRSLSLAPMVFVGKISYSLYLWHWPLLVFGHLIWPHLSLVGTLSILGVAIFLATLSTYGLEQPIRSGKWVKSNRSLLFGSLSLSALLLTAAAFSISSNGMPNRWDYESINQRSINYDLGKMLGAGECFIDNRHPWTTLQENECFSVEKERTNILVIGDSFAAQLMHGLKIHFPAVHYSQGTVSSCRAMVNFWPHPYDLKWPCPKANEMIFEEILYELAFDAIFLISDWQYEQNDGPRVKETIDYIQSVTDTPIFVMGNVPVYEGDFTNDLRVHKYSRHRLSIAPEMRNDIAQMDDYFKKNIDDATFISLLDNYCENTTCPLITASGDLVNFGNHLTEWGSIEIVGASKSEISSALNEKIIMRPGNLSQ